MDLPDADYSKLKVKRSRTPAPTLSDTFQRLLRGLFNIHHPEEDWDATKPIPRRTQEEIDKLNGKSKAPARRV
jgi:hypothetical protein